MQERLQPKDIEIEINKKRLKELNESIKKQERTITLYKTQMRGATQSLSYVLKCSNPMQSDLLTDILQKNTNGLSMGECALQRVEEGRYAPPYEIVEFESPVLFKSSTTNASKVNHNDNSITDTDIEEYILAEQNLKKSTNKEPNKKLNDDLNSPSVWKSIWELYSSQLTENEANTFIILSKLLTGHTLYKKSTPDHSSKLRQFDIINSTEYPPERCGYELRYLYVNSSLKHIIIKQNKEGKSHYKIAIDLIRRPIVSQQVLRTQRKSVEDLFNKKQSEGYYPFYFEMTDGERLNLVATEHEILKVWVMGINELINNKKLIDKFRHIIEDTL